jgi:hypothetical protein
MQLNNGADHVGNMIKLGIIKSGCIAKEAVVKRVNCISEISLNYECFNRRGVTLTEQNIASIDRTPGHGPSPPPESRRKIKKLIKTGA